MKEEFCDDLVGMTEDDANAAVAEEGCIVRITVENGVVVRASIG